MIIDATRPGETILMPEGDWLKQMQIPRIGDLALPMIPRHSSWMEPVSAIGIRCCWRS